MARTAFVGYCPVCEDRTVHNNVRRPGEVGRVALCREHTDVNARLDVGELELAE